MTLSIFDLNLPDPDDIDNIIFVRIPKTASTAVWDFGKSFSWRRGRRQLLKWNGGSHWGGEHVDYSTWKILVNEKSFSFSIVRNPFDMICSKYHHFRAWKNKPKDITFNKFVKNSCSDEKNLFFYERQDHGTMLSSNQRLSKSLFYQIFDNGGRCKVDVIVKYEKIEEGICHIFNDYFKIKKRAKLPKVKVSKTKNKDYREYYTDETRKLVEEYYKNDLEIFGYNFDGSVDDEIFIDPKMESMRPLPKFTNLESRETVEEQPNPKIVSMPPFPRSMRKSGISAHRKLDGKIRKRRRKKNKYVNGAKRRADLESQKNTARYRTVNGRKIKV